ncbi:MAG: hypothetical protein U5N86_04005 [Planctomycetota bacterium]|nr:hypothetical protein [Planctomycetota bacterium]
MAISFEDIDTRYVAGEFGIDAFEGDVDGEYTVSLSEGRFDISGGGVLTAFGGDISFGSFYFVPGKYPEFGFDSVEFHDVDLMLMTAPFEDIAASISGNLQGYIRDFKWSYGSPSAFRIWLHSEPFPGREQRITAGVVNTIEEARKHMDTFNLEIFDYKYIHIGAKLERGIVQISGLPEGEPGTAEQNVLLMGDRMFLFSLGKISIFRMIIRVAGAARGDWPTVWGSIQRAIENIESGEGLEVE